MRLRTVSRDCRTWFDEPQLKSYRVLGYWMTKRIVDAAMRGACIDTLSEFLEFFKQLDLATMRPKSNYTGFR